MITRLLLAHAGDDEWPTLAELINLIWFATIGRGEHRRALRDLEAAEARRRLLRWSRGEQADLERIALS